MGPTSPVCAGERQGVLHCSGQSVPHLAALSSRPPDVPSTVTPPLLSLPLSLHYCLPFHSLFSPAVLVCPFTLLHRDAALMGMRRRIQGLTPDEMRQVAKDVKDLPLTREDCMTALKRVSKSVSKDDLKKYEDWMNEFGSV